MAYVTPGTVAAGDVATAAAWNTLVANDIEFNSRFISNIQKNRIINGAFGIDQRNSGASQTFTAGAALAYSVDRWYGFCTGANITGARIAGSAPFQFNYRFTGAASNTTVGFGTRLEAADTFYLAGQTCTLSAYLASSTLTTVTWSAFYASTTDSFGTLASPTRTSIATGTFTITSLLTAYSVNISVPAAATTGIEIVFTTGALAAAATLTFAGVQFEQGSVATAFDREFVQQTTAKCQRYYQFGSSPATASYAFYDPVGDANIRGINFPISLPVLMRATPTLATSVTNNDNFSFYGSTVTTSLLTLKFRAVLTAAPYGTGSVAYTLSAEL